jgi:GT2 family glycosyltransferase
LAVVVITWNRCAEVLCALQRLTELPERPQIIVVDNGSSDGTATAISQRFPAVELIQAGRNLGAAARNLGVERVDRVYVGFCDDDVWWSPGALSQAADLLDAHPRLALINARVIIEPGQRDDPMCQEMQQSPLKPVEGMPGWPILGFMAGASVVRRSAFLAAGGFSTKIGLGGEEEWLAAELATRGWSMSYVPQISVHHQPSSQRDPGGRRFQIVRNALWFAWLRRPLPEALRQTLALICSGPRDRKMFKGFAAALAGLPRLLPQRRILPPEVEEGLRQLDARRARLRRENR